MLIRSWITGVAKPRRVVERGKNVRIALQPADALVSIGGRGGRNQQWNPYC